MTPTERLELEKYKALAETYKIKFEEQLAAKITAQQKYENIPICTELGDHCKIIAENNKLKKEIKEQKIKLENLLNICKDTITGIMLGYIDRNKNFVIIEDVAIYDYADIIKYKDYEVLGICTSRNYNGLMVVLQM